MSLNHEQAAVLRALRHEPLNICDVAAETGIAEFTVRAVLKSLRSQRLVSDELTSRAHVWKLTRRGWDAVHSEAQMRLT